MNIGALVDLGVPLGHLQSNLSRLGLDDHFELKIDRAKKQGISGTRAQVILKQESHHHRGLGDIKSIIEESTLDAAIKTRAVEMFTELARVEAGIHDVEIDTIHFHEVGAIDAIVDITAAAICLEYLAPDLVVCNGVELGSGMVKCAHGLMPVPAPATAELLRNAPTTRDRVSGEATTPTGATILNHAVTDWEVPDRFVVSSIGYGIGFKDFELPNVLRVSLGNIQLGYDLENNVEISCNIDDMSPEAFEPLIEKLFANGAKDVFMSPIYMKRMRPGTKLSVLVSPHDQEQVVSCLMSDSTTIGVRTHRVQKFMLSRKEEHVPTRYGNVRVKVSSLPSGKKRWKSEYSDVLDIAKKQGIEYLTAKDHVDVDVGKHLAKSQDD